MLCINNRGISIMDTVAKLFDSMVLRRLKLWGSVDQCQAGAREKRGCLEQILTIRMAISTALTLFRLGFQELREAGGGSKRPAAYISSTICNKRLKIGMRGPGSKMRSPKVRFFLIAYYCGRTTHLLYAKLIFLRLSKYLIRPTDFKHHVDEIFMS